MATTKKYSHVLKYDFTVLPLGVTVTDEYPELLAYPEIEMHGRGDNDRWLRYCLLLTSAGSGLLKITDVEQRHREALRLAGIPEKDARADAALGFTDEGVVKMSHALLRDSNNLRLAWVLSAETVLWREIFKARENGDADQDDFFDEVPKRIELLDEEREKLFQKDKLVEKAVIAEARQNEGIVERMVREKNEKK